MKILIADPIADSAVEALRKDFEVVQRHFSPNELLKEINSFHAIIVRSATKIPLEVIENGDNLKVIGRAGVGVDNIDVKAATRKGIYVVKVMQDKKVNIGKVVVR